MGTLTPNGWDQVAKTSGNAEAALDIPARTRRIEVWAKTTDFKVGLSNSASAMFGATADSSICMAGAATPLVFEVSPQASAGISQATDTPVGAREFTKLHYILNAAADGTITVNYFR